MTQREIAEKTKLSLGTVNKAVKELSEKEYISAGRITPQGLDAFILFLYNIVVPSEYYSKKASFIMVGTMVAAIINISLNYVFIQRFGFLAVGYTTLFAYMCYLALHLIISRRLVKFFVLPLKWIAVVCVVLAGLTAWNLWTIDSLFLRWGMCALVVIPVALVLLRNFLREKRENNK